MSRLAIITDNKAEKTIEDIYKDIERRIVASPPGLCPIDLLSSFLKTAHAQSCGKCVPCRIGLGKLEVLLDDVLNGRASVETIDIIKKTAETVYYSSDCAIGWESANMVLKGLEGFKEDFYSHINLDKCTAELSQPVPCRSLCPAGVDVPGYIALIHEERYEDAIRLIRKDNPFPAVCGLICEHPCERRCRRNLIDDSINIRGLKRYAAEMAGNVPAPTPMDKTGKKIAIVGGGPSGLSAAYYLSLMGHNVEVFEIRKKLGGMLIYGIPEYRLPEEILNSEIDLILSTGVKAHTGVEIGKDIKLEDLRRDFDAVYIAIGAQIDKKLEMEGMDANGIYSAVDILREIGDDTYPDFTGKNVSVIGGGNVAMDVARTAVRCNAKKISVLYRRRINDMTALEEEVEAAIAEGCEVYDLYQPLSIEKDEFNNISAVWIQPQIVGAIKDGRPTPNVALKEPVKVDTDILIIAVGQGIESSEFEKFGVSVSKGVISSMETAEVKNLSGFYAGGDCVSGPATVIRAIAAGKVAAANIDEFLGYNHIIETDVVVPDAKLVNKVPCGRINMKERPADERMEDFRLCETLMSHEEAMQESGRCLRCDHFGYGIFKGGRNLKW